MYDILIRYRLEFQVLWVMFEWVYPSCNVMLCVLYLENHILRPIHCALTVPYPMHPILYAPYFTLHTIHPILYAPHFIIIIILGIFYLQVASSPKTWGSKPTCPEEPSEGIAVKSQMSQIK